MTMPPSVTTDETGAIALRGTHVNLLGYPPAVSDHQQPGPRGRKGSKPTMVALFAGGGGLHLGLRQAGFQTLLATDHLPEAARTFQRNLPDVPFHLGDVRRLTPSLVRSFLGSASVDLVVGGPPCQGFSTLGDQRHGDPRNSMFEHFLRVVRWTEPRCVLMENTSYLRSQYAGRFESEVVEAFSRLGFTVSVATLNAADYATPQVRRRAFFVGTRANWSFDWPAATNDGGGLHGVPPWNTVGDAIMDLADLPEDAIGNHLALNHSARVVARYRLIPEGGRMPPPQALPPEIRRRNFGNTYKRLHRNRPSLTLVPGNNAFPVHPTLDRSLTPREAARLQGFPDDYVFEGTVNQGISRPCDGSVDEMPPRESTHSGRMGPNTRALHGW